MEAGHAQTSPIIQKKKKNGTAPEWRGFLYVEILHNFTSLDPRPSDLCILMEGLVRDDYMG